MYTSSMAKDTHSSEVIEVGVRDLRADLKRWLELAQERDVVITDRGKPVARLVPIGEHAGLERLIAQGLVTHPSKPATRVDPSTLVKARGGVADLVAEQRR